MAGPNAGDLDAGSRARLRLVVRSTGRKPLRTAAFETMLTHGPSAVGREFPALAVPPCVCRRPRRKTGPMMTSRRSD